MTVYSAVFSPTGGTQKIVDALCSDEEVNKIDLSLEIDKEIILTSDDICYIGAPSFAGRIPAIALERLAKIKANGAKAILITSFGNRHFDDALLELKDFALSIGFKPFAAVGGVAQHSLMPTYGASRPNKEDVSELKAFAKEIDNLYASLGDNFDLKVIGKSPYVKAQDMPIAPKANSSCTACSKCVKLCPTSAIPKDKPNTTNKKQCIACMRCTVVCPSNARSMNKFVIKLFTFLLKKDCITAKSNSLYLAQ